jgi:hypothetical protein
MKPEYSRAFEWVLSQVKWWDLVDELGWGTATTDYDQIRDALISRLSLDEAVEFRRFIDRAMNLLHSEITDWEEYDDTPTVPCSDDSFSDLRAHIVGLGKKEFSSVMENPLFAYNRAMAKYGTKEGYKESFLYAIPYHTDYLEKVGTNE